MFSVLGARLLIQEVHAKSWLAGLVGGLLARTRVGRAAAASSGRASLERSASVASSASVHSMCCSSAADCSEIEEAGGSQPGGSRHLRRCSSAWSSASSASLAAFAAEAASEEGSEGGASVDRALPMFPPGEGRKAPWGRGAITAHALHASCRWGCCCAGPEPRGCPACPAGRILWMLPDERDPSAKPQLVEVDQNAVS